MLEKERLLRKLKKTKAELDFKKFLSVASLRMIHLLTSGTTSTLRALTH